MFVDCVYLLLMVFAVLRLGVGLIRLFPVSVFLFGWWLVVGVVFVWRFVACWLLLLLFSCAWFGWFTLVDWLICVFAFGLLVCFE